MRPTFYVLKLAILFATVSPAAAGVRETRTLFHAGDRAILQEDIDARTVPQEAWDKFIMGKTNFDLPDYRKGLYGAETIGGTSLYSLYKFLDGRDGWVMTVKLKPACLRADAMQTGGYTVSSDLVEPGRFAKWYSANRAKYQALEPKCLEKYSEFSEWHEGILYDLNKAHPEEIERSNTCTAVLNDYLKDEKLKTVYDAVNPLSWYVRDRDCLETITGTPDDLFTLILDQNVGDPDEEFIPNFFGRYGEPGVFYGGSTLLLFNVVAETKLLSVESLPRLAKLEKELSVWIGDANENRALTLDDNGDCVSIARHLLRAVTGAVKKKKTAALQKVLREDLVALRKTFKTECDGKFGIPAGKRESCARATEAQTATLIRHLLPFER